MFKVLKSIKNNNFISYNLPMYVFYDLLQIWFDMLDKWALISSVC